MRGIVAAGHVLRSCSPTAFSRVCSKSEQCAVNRGSKSGKCAVNRSNVASRNTHFILFWMLTYVVIWNSTTLESNSVHFTAHIAEKYLECWINCEKNQARDGSFPPHCCTLYCTLYCTKLEAPYRGASIFGIHCNLFLFTAHFPALTTQYIRAGLRLSKAK